jgi:2,4-dienoyl-CoA reductase-like NADH-dependent reductase (Old Yellow Enzyme family)
MTSTRFESDFTGSIAPLAQPLHFSSSNRTAKNRLLKASMAEQQASWSLPDPHARGIPSASLIELYRRWGEPANSFGLILTGNIQASVHTPGGAGDMLIDLASPLSGPRFDAYRALAAAAKASGSLVIGQVGHPGRQMPAKYADEVVSASAVPLPPVFGAQQPFARPRAATPEDIRHIVDSFVHAAVFLEAAGFDGVELHAAHGYLLSQFLATRTNQRTDAYGGPLRNRMRLLVEISQAVRSQTKPDFILGVKLNSVEFQDGGFSPDEAAELAAVLQDEVGLDFIELSGGTYEKLLGNHMYEKESTRQREAFFLEFAEQLIVPALGRERKTKVYITGGFRTAGAMVQALDVVDGVGVARAAAQEPRLASDILEGRVKGAIKPLPPFDDIGMGLPLGGAQMQQVGKGQEPLDSSDPKALEAFQQDLGRWYAKSAEDADGEGSGGYPEVTFASRPYGQANLVETQA